MAIPETVVPAYPYEGAIYWLLGEPTTRHSQSHPYYATLYGLTPEQVLPKAGALAALFENIELASADHGLPERTRYSGENGYFHPELRLSISHKEHEWTSEADSLAEFCFKTHLVDHLFRQHKFFSKDRFLQRHFLSRLLLQVRLAIRLNALLVGDAFFHAVYKTVSPFIKQFIDDTPGQLPEGLTLELNEKTFAAIGLEFAPASFDSFIAIRASEQIASYAVSYRQALGMAREHQDFESALLDLMRSALDTEAIARHVTGAMQTTGSITNIVGLIPVVGTIASLGSIGADLVGRVAAAKALGQQWYLIGSEMRTIGLKQLLLKR